MHGYVRFSFLRVSFGKNRIALLSPLTAQYYMDRFRCCAGVEGLSITVGRGGLRRYTGAQVAAGQSVEAGYSVVQQVSKSYSEYLIIKYVRRP